MEVFVLVFGLGCQGLWQAVVVYLIGRERFQAGGVPQPLENALLPRVGRRMRDVASDSLGLVRHTSGSAHPTSLPQAIRLRLANGLKRRFRAGTLGGDAGQD